MDTIMKYPAELTKRASELKDRAYKEQHTHVRERLLRIRLLCRDRRTRVLADIAPNFDRIARRRPVEKVSRPPADQNIFPKPGKKIRHKKWPDQVRPFSICWNVDS
jgi:hypothetical protein